MSHENIVRLDFITDGMLEYLDDLRESGITNMFGGVEYLLNEFPELGKTDARKVLSYWMETFGNEDR
jgi:hypothetical protein